MSSFDRFAAFADHGGTPFEKAKPRKPKSTRFAGYAGVDEEGFIPNSKGMTMTDYDTSRGPWHAMIDKQALGIQAQTGWRNHSLPPILIQKIPRLSRHIRAMIWQKRMMQ